MPSKAPPGERIAQTPRHRLRVAEVITIDRRAQHLYDRLREREVHLGNRRDEDVAVMARPLLAPSVDGASPD